jgi:acyl-CoA thioester hydrolase
MARIKITLPEHFDFFTIIHIRITDLNYGSHVGNDSILSIMHEARMQFLQSFGYSELDIGGAGLIMSDAAIEFKAESFYKDVIKIYVAAADFTSVSFNLYYKLEKEIEGGNNKLLATGKTGMVFFNYETKKIVAIPEEVKNKLTALK